MQKIKAFYEIQTFSKIRVRQIIFYNTMEFQEKNTKISTFHCNKNENFVQEFLPQPHFIENWHT